MPPPPPGSAAAGKRLALTPSLDGRFNSPAMPSPRTAAHPPPLPLPPGERQPGQWQLRPGAAVTASNTKALHWEALGAAEGTLWSEAASDADARSNALDVDSAEIASLFANKPAAASAAPQRSADAAAPKKAAAVLDSQRARNCEIMLRRACRSAPAASLIAAVARFELSEVPMEAVTGMAAFIPETAEATRLRAAPAAALAAPAEAFMAAVLRVPRWAAALRCAAYGHSLDASVAAASASLEVASSFAREVTSSTALPGVMRAILSVGNVMNAGTARGGARGFRLASLEQLSRTRSGNGKTTLLHYLAKLLEAKMPALLTWHASLPSLAAAQRADLPAAAADAEALRNGATALRSDAERAAAAAEAESEDLSVASDARAFAANARAFLAAAQPRLAALQVARADALASADAAVAHFGENPATTSLADIAAALAAFKAAFDNAVADNARDKAREKATERALEDRIAKEGAKRAAASSVASSVGTSSGAGSSLQDEVSRAMSRRRGGMSPGRDREREEELAPRAARRPAVLSGGAAPAAVAARAPPPAAPAVAAAASLFGALKSRFASPPRPKRETAAAPPRLKSPPRGRAEEATHRSSAAAPPPPPRFKSPPRGRTADAPARG
jgi:hypothetical protein